MGVALQDGKLLEVAQREFDGLITTDRGIPHQQNLSRFDLAIVILHANSNAVRDLSPLMEEVSGALSTTRPGQVIRIGGLTARRARQPATA